MDEESSISESVFALRHGAFPRTPELPALLREGDLVRGPARAYRILGAPLEVDVNNAACHRARAEDSGEIVFFKAYLNPAPGGENDWTEAYVAHSAALYRRVAESPAGACCADAVPPFVAPPEDAGRAHALADLLRRGLSTDARLRPVAADFAAVLR